MRHNNVSILYGIGNTTGIHIGKIYQPYPLSPQRFIVQLFTNDVISPKEIICNVLEVRFYSVRFKVLEANVFMI